jgi:hypothetical protein
MTSVLPLLTVVETQVFASDADKLMSQEERRALIWHVAAHPDDGDLMPGTGGARKLRWARTGMGKRCGFRVITFFHDWEMPVFLLAIFAKGERTDLSQAEKNALSGTLKAIVQEYKGKKIRRRR